MSSQEFDIPLRNFDKSLNINLLPVINSALADNQYYHYKPTNLKLQFQNNCANDDQLPNQQARQDEYKILRSPSPIYKGQLQTERVYQKSSLKLSPKESSSDLQRANESFKAVQNTDRAGDQEKFKIVLNKGTTSNLGFQNNNSSAMNNSNLAISNLSKRNLQSIYRSKSAIGNIPNTSVSYSNIHMPQHLNLPLQMPHLNQSKIQYLPNGLCNLTNLNDSLEQLNLSTSQMAGTYLSQPQIPCQNCGNLMSNPNECSIDYISKINDLKKILRKKEQDYQKQTAILKQQVHLLEMQATDFEQREEKMKRNHESMLKAYKSGGNFGIDGSMGTISELEILRQSRDELKKTKDQLESSVLDLNDKLKQKDFEINNLILTNDDKDIFNERKVQDLQLDKRNLENKIRRLENQLQRSDLNELTLKTQNQQREIDKLKDKIQESAQEHTQEVIKLKKCQEEFHEQMKCQSQQLEFVQTQLKHREIQRQNDQNQIERLDEQVKTFERQVEEMEQQVEDLTLQLGVKEQTVIQMQQQIQSLVQQQSQQFMALDGTQIEEMTNRYTQLTSRKLEQSPSNHYRADLEIQRITDENDYLLNQIQSQKNTIANQQEQIKQYLNNETFNLYEIEKNNEDIQKRKEIEQIKIGKLQNEVNRFENLKLQLQETFNQESLKLKEQIISFKHQYQELKQQSETELQNRLDQIEKLQQENKSLSQQLAERQQSKCPLADSRSPDPNSEMKLEGISVSKQSLIYINGQNCSASHQNISVISSNLINNTPGIQNAYEGAANNSVYQHISRIHDNDDSLITISGGGNIIYQNKGQKNKEALQNCNQRQLAQQANEIEGQKGYLGNSQMSYQNENNTLNLNWSINDHKNYPADAGGKCMIQEVSAIQGTGITVQDQEDDERLMFVHNHQPSTATDQNLMPTYQSSIATIQGFTSGLVDINQFNNQQAYHNQIPNGEAKYQDRLDSNKVEISTSELDLLYCCQKIIDAASSMKCIKCERIFQTTDFYDHIIVQRECIIFESENGKDLKRNQGGLIMFNQEQINNENLRNQPAQQQPNQEENYEIRSSNCNIDMRDKSNQDKNSSNLQKQQKFHLLDLPLQISHQNSQLRKNQYQNTHQQYSNQLESDLKIDQLNNQGDSTSRQMMENVLSDNNNQSNYEQPAKDENFIEEMRPSYLLSADPVTHIQPNIPRKKQEFSNNDNYMQNKRISTLSPFGGNEKNNQNSTSGEDFSKKQIHSNSISKTGKEKKYCNNYQFINGGGKSISNGGLLVSQYSQNQKGAGSNNNGCQNAQEFGSRSGMGYSRGTVMTGTVNSNILMSLSRSNTSRSNYSGQEILKDPANGSFSPSQKPKTGIFTNDEDNIKYLAANYHRDKSGLPLSNNPNTTQISKNNPVYTEQNLVTDSMATNEQFFYDNAEAARILLAISDRSPTNFSRFEQQINATGAANSKRTNTKRELQANDLLALKSIKSQGKSSQENMNADDQSFIYKNSTNIINKHMQFNKFNDQEEDKKNSYNLSQSLRDIVNINRNLDIMIEDEEINKVADPSQKQLNPNLKIPKEYYQFQKQEQMKQLGKNHKSNQSIQEHQNQMQIYLDSQIQQDKNKNQLLELEKLYELDTSRFEEEYSNLTSSKKKILLKQLIDDDNNIDPENQEIQSFKQSQTQQFYNQNFPKSQLQINNDKSSSANCSRNGGQMLGFSTQQHFVKAPDSQNMYTSANLNYNQFINLNTLENANEQNKSSALSLSQKNMMTETASRLTDQGNQNKQSLLNIQDNSSQNSKQNQIKRIGLNLAPIINKNQQVQKISASRISIIDPNIQPKSSTQKQPNQYDNPKSNQSYNHEIKDSENVGQMSKPKFDLSQKFEQLKQFKSEVGNSFIQGNQHQVKKLKLKKQSSKGFQMTKKKLSIDTGDSNSVVLNNQIQQEQQQIAQKSQNQNKKQADQNDNIKVKFENLKNIKTQKVDKNQQIKFLKEVIKVSKSPQNQYNQFLFGQHKQPESLNSFRCLKSENENVFPDKNQIQSPMSSYFPSQNKKSNIIQTKNAADKLIISEQKKYPQLSENHSIQKRKVQHFRSNIVNQNCSNIHGHISSMSQLSKNSNPSNSQQIEPQLLLNKSESHNSPRYLIQNASATNVQTGKDISNKAIDKLQSKTGQIKKQISLTCLKPQSFISSEKQKDLDTSAAFDINFGSEINSPVSKKMGFAGSTIGKAGGAIGLRVNQSQKNEQTGFMHKITEEDQMASGFKNQSTNQLNDNEDCNEMKEFSEANSQELFNGQESQRHMLGKQQRLVPTLIVNQDDKIFMEEKLQINNFYDDENLNDEVQHPLRSNREQMQNAGKYINNNYLTHQAKTDFNQNTSFYNRGLRMNQQCFYQENNFGATVQQDQIKSTLQFTNPNFNTQKNTNEKNGRGPRSPHQKNTDYIRQSILQSSERRNTSYKSKEVQEINNKQNQVQKKVKVAKYLQTTERSDLKQKFYEEQEFPSFLDDQDFDEFSQNVDGTMRKQNATMRADIQNLYKSEVLENVQNQSIDCQNKIKQNNRNLLKNFQTQILNEPPCKADDKIQFQKGNQILFQQVQRDTIKIGQNNVYSNPPSLKSSKQILQNAIHQSKLDQSSYSKIENPKVIKNQNLFKSGFSLASTQNQLKTTKPISQQQIDSHQQVQKQVYFNDSEPRHQSKQPFHPQKFTEATLTKYEKFTNQSELFNQSSLIAGSQKQIVPAKTPNNEQLMQTVRSEANYLHNNSSQNFSEQSRVSKNKSNSVFAKGVSTSIHKQSRNNNYNKFQSSAITGVQAGQPFQVQGLNKHIQTQGFFTKNQTSEQAARTFNNVQIENTQLGLESSSQSLQEMIYKHQDNFFISKDPSSSENQRQQAPKTGNLYQDRQ